jgi:hypothetical protein
VDALVPPTVAPRITARARVGVAASSASARRTRARPWASAIAALAGYVCLSLLLYGHDVLGNFSHAVVGSGQGPAFYGRDQSSYVWFLARGAHAFTHLENPLWTSAVYAPGGYNLAWAASIIGPALTLTPLTEAIGAVAAFNVVALLAPAIAAWGAFLLCSELTRRRSSALVGGLLFGFCTYESIETVNHLSLAMVALLPLAAWLVVRRHRGRMTRVRFIAALGFVLALQLWTSTEVFASLIVFGTIAFALAIAIGGRSRWRPGRTLALETVGALALAAVLCAPAIYYVLAYPNPLEGHSAAGAGADLAGFVIPTELTWLHGHGHLATAAAALAGNRTERLAYIGPAMIVLLVAFAVSFRRRPLGRLLLAFIALSVLLSLGSHLVVDGHDTHVTLPWGPIAELPLLGHALPGRFVVYPFLAVAVAVALWLDRPGARPARWVLAALAVISLAPNVTVPWASRVDSPALMREPLLARYVPSGATVLALPFGMSGDSMYWQLESGFRFRLAGGYVSWALPTPYRHQSILHELIGRPPGGSELARLCAFLSTTGARVMLLREGTPGDWPAIMHAVPVRPRRAGGFAIYDLASMFGPRRACAAAAVSTAANGAA